jgi:gamma-glutamyltranspeptidase/glutathione hydrolase
LAVGETMVLPELAGALETIAEEGPDAFYSGAIARRIAEDMVEHGGYITYEDLKNYEARFTAPVTSTYRGHVIAASAPPGSGFQILQVLKILEPFDLVAIGLNTAEYIRIVSRAMKVDFRDRAEYLADPEFASVPIDRLLSADYCAQWSKRIAAGSDVPGPPQPLSERGTTHLVAIDAAGNAVSLTHSLGSTSGVVTPGLGFLYNNHMEQYWPLPGHRNSIEPGKRRPAGTGATIILHDDRPMLLTGSAGGSRIVTSVAQCILNVIDHEMSALEAVAAPRFHCEGDEIYVEASVSASVCATLERMGYKVLRSVYGYDTSFVFGVVQSLLVGPSGQLQAAPDVRGGGGVVYYSGA